MLFFFAKHAPLPELQAKRGRMQEGAANKRGVRVGGAECYHRKVLSSKFRAKEASEKSASQNQSQSQATFEIDFLPAVSRKVSFEPKWPHNAITLKKSTYF